MIFLKFRGHRAEIGTGPRPTADFEACLHDSPTGEAGLGAGPALRGPGCAEPAHVLLPTPALGPHRARGDDGTRT
jgi:hypothetical protein